MNWGLVYAKLIQFQQAVSSDWSKPSAPMGIVLEELGLTARFLTVMISASANGALEALMEPGDGTLGVLPRVFRVDDFHHLSLIELAEGIVGGTQPWLGRVLGNPS